MVFRSDLASTDVSFLWITFKSLDVELVALLLLLLVIGLAIEFAIHAYVEMSLILVRVRAARVVRSLADDMNREEEARRAGIVNSNQDVLNDIRRALIGVYWRAGYEFVFPLLLAGWVVVEYFRRC